MIISIFEFRYAMHRKNIIYMLLKFTNFHSFSFEEVKSKRWLRCDVNGGGSGGEDGWGFPFLGRMTGKSLTAMFTESNVLSLYLILGVQT